MRRLKSLFADAGFKVHSAAILRQQRAFFARTAAIERVLVRITPGVRLLVCAHKSA
jgi:hypothetical protein